MNEYFNYSDGAGMQCKNVWNRSLGRTKQKEKKKEKTKTKSSYLNLLRNAFEYCYIFYVCYEKGKVID